LAALFEFASAAARARVVAPDGSGWKVKLGGQLHARLYVKYLDLFIVVRRHEVAKVEVVRIWLATRPSEDFA
jgi:hypothetical protein